MIQEETMTTRRKGEPGCPECGGAGSLRIHPPDEPHHYEPCVCTKKKVSDDRMWCPWCGHEIAAEDVEHRGVDPVFHINLNCNNPKCEAVSTVDNP